MGQDRVDQTLKGTDNPTVPKDGRFEELKLQELQKAAPCLMP